jgi:hypothetical protein
MTNESNGATRGAWWAHERVLSLDDLPKHVTALRGVTVQQMGKLRVFRLADGKHYTTFAEVERVAGRPVPDRA